jgi:hypothetical protein
MSERLSTPYVSRLSALFHTQTKKITDVIISDSLFQRFGILLNWETIKTEIKRQVETYNHQKI